MTLGSLEGRILLGAGLVLLMLAWDVLRPWLLSKLRSASEERGASAEAQAVDPVRSAEAAAAREVAASRAAKEKAEPSPESLERVSRLHRREDLREAQKKWIAARKMSHHVIPNWKTDWDYLSLLHQAANAGETAAMNKLSEYAFRRNAFVEAYYWKLKLEMQGGKISKPAAADVLKVWKRRGCPAQHDGTNPGFSEERSMFARSVMRLRAGVDVAKASERLTMLSEEGNADAQQYLQRGKRRTPKL